ncbi:MAG: hypothetical protein IID37_13885, partial [Planctomycetes bacterium]|nr:hypothetical protein [Planctomycetota bacterium]
DDNLRLRTGPPASPCIEAGDNTPLPVGESGTRDLDNTPRVADGDCDLSAVVDMGSYEYNPTSAQCP